MHSRTGALRFNPHNNNLEILPFFTKAQRAYAEKLQGAVTCFFPQSIEDQRRGVSFDSASAFVPSSSRKSVATISGAEDGALHVADTPMDTSTPARAGSIARGESTQSIVATGVRAPIGGSSTNLVTLPLLQAIRTTAAHTLATSP